MNGYEKRNITTEMEIVYFRFFVAGAGNFQHGKESYRIRKGFRHTKFHFTTISIRTV